MSKASTKHAFARQHFNLGDRGIPNGAVIFDMPESQFNDLSAEGVDLVREATRTEVAEARKAPTVPSEPPVEGEPA